mgnify:CR=1
NLVKTGILTTHPPPASPVWSCYISMDTPRSRNFRHGGVNEN